MNGWPRPGGRRQRAAQAIDSPVARREMAGNQRDVIWRRNLRLASRDSDKKAGFKRRSPGSGCEWASALIGPPLWQLVRMWPDTPGRLERIYRLIGMPRGRRSASQYRSVDTVTRPATEARDLVIKRMRMGRRGR